MVFHTFGDSHSGTFFSTVEGVVVNPLGPVLCYTFGTKKLDRLNILNYGVKDGDSCLFSFGEIDCRCHVNKHVTEDNTYQNIIDHLVQNYFDAIKLNVDQLNNIKVFVHNVVPPPQLYNTWVDFGYPFIGSDEERRDYATYFNSKIKEYCELFNYTFFDVYDKYIDENGYLLKKYSDDHVHINDHTFFKEFIIKNNISLL